MFESIREFFEFMDVNPMWPAAIIALTFVRCLFPYKPIAKIKEEQDEEGKKTYTVYKHMSEK